MATDDTKYKKFLFNRRFDETDDELAQAESEIKEVLDLDFEKNSDDILEKMINQEEVVPEEPVYVPPTYTQEELDAAVKKAEQQGFSDGEKHANEKIAKQDADALVLIEKKLEQVKTDIDEYLKQTQTDFVKLSSVLFRKLMPEFEKKSGFLEIEGILNTYFPRLFKEPQIKLTLNPEQTPTLKEKITEIVKKSGFLGKIVIQNNEEINLTDIAIEWDKGGVVRDTDMLMDEVDKILSAYSKQEQEVSGEK